MSDRRVKTMVAVVVAAVGCGEGGGGGDAGVDAPDAATAPVMRGAVWIAERRATVDRDTTPREVRSAGAGAIYYEGRRPVFHQEVMRSTDCVLRRYTPSACEPVCTGGLCVATDVCEPWPVHASAGPLTATGLAVPLTMVAADGVYEPDVALPEDLFADEAAIAVALAGATFPAHTIESRGVPPLVAEIVDGAIGLAAGEVHVVRWTPATTDARVRVTLNSSSDGPELPYAGVIECDARDAAGQVVIPAEMVDAFPSTQVWDACPPGIACPASTIRRYRRGTTVVGEAEVELVVASELAFGVHPAP